MLRHPACQDSHWKYCHTSCHYDIFDRNNHLEKNRCLFLLLPSLHWFLCSFQFTSTFPVLRQHITKKKRQERAEAGRSTMETVSGLATSKAGRSIPSRSNKRAQQSRSRMLADSGLAHYGDQTLSLVRRAHDLTMRDAELAWGRRLSVVGHNPATL
jgi:hypothetical protein